MTEFKPGDRVCSNVGGLYMGMPGTILEKAQMQYGDGFTRWTIELDIGKRLGLSNRFLRLLEKC